MPQLLLEDAWPFRPDRSKIQESREGALKVWRVPGTLSLCDVPNGNNRVYPRPVWESNLKAGSPLMLLIDQRAAFGTLEHPKDGVVDLSSPISHMVVEATLGQDGVVSGDILILDTEPGRKLKVLIEAGYNPLVSSRGYGSVNKRADGKDEVQTDFICEGWDVVIRPSFGSRAALSPQRESAASPTTLVGAEVTALAEAQEQRVPVAVKAVHTPSPIMDLKTIRPLIESLRGLDPAKSSPQSLAEGFSRATEIHNAIAEVQAADPKSGWACTQAHGEVSKLEESWNAAIVGQRKAVEKLTEDRSKLLAVSESTAKVARIYREQLTEEVKRHGGTKALMEQIITRGRGWKAHADKQTTQLGLLEHQLEVASLALEMMADMVKKGKKLQEKLEISCLANDMLASQYVTETGQLARKLVEAQLGDKLTPAAKKKLAEAITAEDALNVKKSLTESAPAPVATPVVTPAAAPIAGAPSRQSVTLTEGIQILQTGPSNPTSINESLEIAARMRGAAKA